MKQVKKNIGLALSSLHKKAISAEKASVKALADYEKKLAVCGEADGKKLDKFAAYELIAALKIAKFTYKIKKTQHKLAKNALKVAEKVEKKNNPAPAAAEKTILKSKKTVAPTEKSAKAKKGESVSDQGKATPKSKKVAH